MNLSKGFFSLHPLDEDKGRSLPQWVIAISVILK